MRATSSLLIAALVSFAGPATFAHEGHGHSAAEAPHGGVLQEGKKLNLELVTQGADAMLYPLSKDGKALPLKDVQVTATTQLPKKAKSKLEFKPMDDHFHGKVETKGSYRYELQIETKFGGAQEKFTFQVEPQG